MRRRISGALRASLIAEAENRCGYCLAPQELVIVIFEAEHIRPRSRGGGSAVENLWLSCPTCNRFKGDAVSGTDPITGRHVRLFNPRRQQWRRHFRWEGLLIAGVSPTGRATVEALRLNDALHAAPRRVWALLGIFPPDR